MVLEVEVEAAERCELADGGIVRESKVTFETDLIRANQSLDTLFDMLWKLCWSITKL